MSSSALLANGTLVKRGDGASSESFVTVPEARGISGPNLESPLVDATDQESGGREFIQGLIDFGELSFEMMYLVTDTQQNLVRSDHVNRTKQNYQLEFPDDPTTPTLWQFECWVIAFGMAANLDNPLLVNVRLKLSGAINFSA
jgi:hypothetical protein